MHCINYESTRKKSATLTRMILQSIRMPAIPTYCAYKFIDVRNLTACRVRSLKDKVHIVLTCWQAAVVDRQRRIEHESRFDDSSRSQIKSEAATPLDFWAQLRFSALVSQVLGQHDDVTDKTSGSPAQTFVRVCPRIPLQFCHRQPLPRFFSALESRA